jgi:hypothetical protein
MKIFIVFVASFICFAYGRHRRETTGNDLPFFPVERLNTEFRNFQLEGCSNEVDQCLKTVHDKAKTCVTTFKTNPKVDSCLNRDDIKERHKTFQEASFKWHKSLDLCLAGNECEDCPSTIQNDQPAYDNDDNDDFESFREKRMVHGRDGRDSSESNEGSDSESEQLKKSVSKCWKGVKKAKKECMKQATRCQPFAQCYGEGARPTDARLAAWYDSIKTQRDSTERTGKENLKLMLSCIATAPVRSARDALIADPEGVIVEPDEY